MGRVLSAVFVILAFSGCGNLGWRLPASANDAADPTDTPPPAVAVDGTAAETPLVMVAANSSPWLADGGYDPALTECERTASVAAQPCYVVEYGGPWQANVARQFDMSGHLLAIGTDTSAGFVPSEQWTWSDQGPIDWSASSGRWGGFDHRTWAYETSGAVNSATFSGGGIDIEVTWSRVAGNVSAQASWDAGCDECGVSFALDGGESNLDWWNRNLSRSWALRFDDQGRTLEEIATDYGCQGQGCWTKNNYDGEGRLLRYQHGADDASATVQNIWVGDRLDHTVSSTSSINGYGNAITRFTYDAADRVIVSREISESHSPTNVWRSDRTVFFKRGCGTGEPLSIDVFSNQGEATGSITYAHDANGRIVEEVYSGAAIAEFGRTRRTLQYCSP